MCLYFMYYKVHTDLLHVQRAQPFGKRSAPLQNDGSALRRNKSFLPAENDSSFLKVPSWRLSADVIY